MIVAVSLKLSIFFAMRSVSSAPLTLPWLQKEVVAVVLPPDPEFLARCNTEDLQYPSALRLALLAH